MNHSILNVAGRLTVLPADCKIHPHLTRGRVLISGPVYIYVLAHKIDDRQRNSLIHHVIKKVSE